MKEYILPYKDKPELLLQPPAEYNYIPVEDWRKLVANRLSTKFEIKSRREKKDGQNIFTFIELVGKDMLDFKKNW